MNPARTTLVCCVLLLSSRRKLDLRNRYTCPPLRQMVRLFPRPLLRRYSVVTGPWSVDHRKVLYCCYGVKGLNFSRTPLPPPLPPRGGSWSRRRPVSRSTCVVLTSPRGPFSSVHSDSSLNVHYHPFPVSSDLTPSCLLRPSSRSRTFPTYPSSTIFLSVSVSSLFRVRSPQ